MDPDPLNFNQPFRGGGLPTSHGSLNRYDLSLLSQDQGTPFTGLGLGSFPAHSSLTAAAARSFAPLPGYSHGQHGVLPPLQENLSHLHSMAAQAQYRSLSTGQSAFPFTDTCIRGSPADQYSRPRLNTTQALHSKPLFTQDPSVISQISPSHDSSSKGWGLSNFVSPTSNPFDLSLADNLMLTSHATASTAPPPAHTSKINSGLQRNQFPDRDVYSETSLPAKSPTSYHSFLYGYSRALDARASGQPTTSPQVSQLSSVNSQASSLYSESGSITNKTQPSVYSSTMDYDPVSPASPLSDAGQQNDNLVSLQDIASMQTTDEKLSKNRDRDVSPEYSRPVSSNCLPFQTLQSQHEAHIVSMKNKANLTLQELYSQPSRVNSGTPNGQSYSVGQSPTQQSPISVGGSPHHQQYQTGSPLSSKANITSIPIPIQAPADSTTKPKRRGRKKKETAPVLKKSTDIISMYEEHSNPIYQQQQTMLKAQNFNLKQPVAGETGNSAQQNQDIASLFQTGGNSSGLQGDTFIDGQDFLSDSRGSVGNFSNKSVIHSGLSSSIASNQSDILNQKLQLSREDQTQVMSHSQNQLPFNREPKRVVQKSSSHIVSQGHQSPYLKDDASPSFVPQPSPVQLCTQPSPVHQHSPSVSGYQSQSPMPTHNPVHYSVAEALELTDNEMVGLHGNSVYEDSSQGQQHTVLDRYDQSSRNMSTDMVNAFGLQDGGNGSFSASLGLADNLSSCNDHYQNSQNNPLYTTSNYGEPFMNPGAVMGMDPSLDNSPSRVGPTSTIDEAAFSSLMDESASREPTPEKIRCRTKAEQKQMPFIPLTVKVDVEYDDDFQHLATPVLEPSSSNNNHHRQKSLSNQQSVLDSKASQPKPDTKCVLKSPSFLDSYLNFVQGKKPETLSSMTNAVIHNKPQLPKYIPEPPRKRRPPDPVHSDHDSSSNTARPEMDAKSESSGSGKSGSFENSVLVSSDEDGDRDLADTDDSQAISNLSGDNDKVKISTNKSGGLTMKINLAKVKASTEAKKSKSRKSTSSKSRKNKNKSKRKDSVEAFSLGYSSGEEVAVSPVAAESAVELRKTSSRKAKEISKKKYDLTESDEDSDIIHEIRKPRVESDSDKCYDSDRDPSWTPLSLEKRAPPFEVVGFSDRTGKKMRGKGKGTTDFSKSPGSSSSRRQSGEKRSSMSESTLSGGLMPAAKLVKLTDAPVNLPDTESEEEQALLGTEDNRPLQVGEFVLEKKDQKNFESYPIWKIESGRMLHKFELYKDESKILHRAVPTFSSWLPNMRSSFVHIRIHQIYKQKDKDIVEVQEAFRPKPVIDSRLETEIEEHPLVEMFNTYLQIFLSQALEPGFLSAIRESNDTFYMEPLQKIDAAIENRLHDIDSKVKWKGKFQESVKARPHIRELDRPNLKQSCQACEFASQPAIKSIHLFGNPYCRYSLDEQPQEGGPQSQEFMIGKTAAHYVKPYHNLYHFKCNLYKRCLAKVNLIQDGSDPMDNATILDQCLQNRAWVLQIFQDLKKMLEKG